MENTVYHVLLGDRRLGPYDRRTIVGMRLKKALRGQQVLEASDGAQLTVAELVRGRPPEAPPPDFTGLPRVHASSHSVVQATLAADLLEVEPGAYALPPFTGEIEVRVQTRALRLSGRFREGLAWKEDRVKFPLQDIVHARLQGSVVELGVRPPEGEGLQRLRLELRSPDAAGELAERLPHTVPLPGSEPLAGRGNGSSPAFRRRLWTALLATAAATSAAGAAAWLLLRAG